jgi:ABC-type uncharacterized transport system ATPase subunit
VADSAIEGLSIWATRVVRDDGMLLLDVENDDAAPRIVRHLVESDADVFEVTMEATSLEETFIQLVGEDRGL